MRRLHLAFVTLGDHSYAGLVVDERIHHACGVHRSTVGRACAGGVRLSGAGDIGAQLRAVSRVPRMQRGHYGPRYFRSDTVATHRHNGGVRRGTLCLNSTRCLVHDGRARAVERADCRDLPTAGPDTALPDAFLCGSWHPLLEAIPADRSGGATETVAKVHDNRVNRIGPDCPNKTGVAREQ
mgnify:CR=1 FL=1